MTPEDIRRIVVVEELDLSADGRTAVVVRRSIQGNRYVSHLFAIDLGSRRAIPTPRQLTRGTIRDTRPRLCPDGHTLAFVRTDPTDDDSVGVDHDPGPPTRGRPASREGGRHGAVGEIAWSPDGRRLAFTAEVDPPRFIAGTTRPISRRGKSGSDEAPVARHITRTDWRWDEQGHRDRWSHLFVIDSRSAPAAPGHERRLGRLGHRVASRQPNDRVHHRPRSGARPPLADDDLGGRCR